MKRFALLFLFFAFTLTSYSQRVYFLYIQSENEQPFYLKMQERIYSSASKGYLILSNLRDSSYNFSLGFPGGNIVEQKFDVRINAKDHGYILKNFNEKGWGLFDLQTMGVQMSKSDEKTIGNIKKESVKKDESAFTQILAKASDDSTLLEKPDLTQIKKEEKKETVTNEAPKQPEQKTEEKKTEVKTPETIEEKKTETVEDKSMTEKNELPVATVKEELRQKTDEAKQTQSETYKRSEVVRRSESSTTEGFGVIFTDEYNDGKKDTIKIIIPQPKESMQSETKEVKEEKKFLDIVDTVKQVANEQPKEEKITTSQSEAKIIVKNKCQSMADEDDFFKLRKKMAGIPEDDNMISEARKAFKTRCFTTEQIKNLSTLFLSDGGKYKFFDAAYEHVSDIENFPALQTELKGEYYINRFKAMLRN